MGAKSFDSVYDDIRTHSLARESAKCSHEFATNFMNYSKDIRANSSNSWPSFFRWCDEVVIEEGGHDDNTSSNFRTGLLTHACGGYKCIGLRPHHVQPPPRKGPSVIARARGRRAAVGNSMALHLRVSEDSHAPASVSSPFACPGGSCRSRRHTRVPLADAVKRNTPSRTSDDGSDRALRSYRESHA